MQQDLSSDIDGLNASPPKGLPIGSLTRMVQRKIILIAGVTGIVSAAAWLASSADPLTYGGSFRLLVEPVTSEARLAEPAALTRTNGGVPSRDAFSLDYPTQLEILQSPKVLGDVYQQVKAKYPNFTFIDLLEGLVVGRTGQNLSDATKILQVSYQGTDPDLVQLVLEKVAERYLKYSLEDRKTRISEGVKFIEDQLPSLQQRVDKLQGQLQAIQQQYDLIDPATQGQQFYNQAQALTAQQIETQRQIQEQSALYISLQRQLQMTPAQAIATSTLTQDPQYQNLLKTLQDIESQIAIESTRFSEESPIIRRLRERQNNITVLLNQEVQRILGKDIATTGNRIEVPTFQNSIHAQLTQQLVDTVNQLQILTVRNRALDQTKNAYEQQARQFPVITRQYSEIQRQLEIATRTLDQLLTQRETLRVEAAQNQVPWELISPPLIPRDAAGIPMPDPVSSQRKLMMGVVLGLALGLGLAYLLEKYQDTFYTVDDVRDALPSPVLGIIPVYENRRSALALLHTASSTVENSGKTQLLEALNELCAGVHFLDTNQAVRSLIVCSASAGDGKSTTAVCLAVAMAGMGQRVLLVDANLHTPQVHTWLDLSNTQGLSEFLLNKIEIQDAIQSSAIENLSVLTAGHPSIHSARLLASARMQQLMKENQARFDMVIYDTPELTNLVDAQFLATSSDGILLVVTVGKTSRSAVKQTVEKLNAHHLPIIGVVANGTSEAKQKQSLQDDVGEMPMDAYLMQE